MCMQKKRQMKTSPLRAYTEVSTTEAKDDVLVDDAAKQAVKERGARTVGLPSKLIKDEASRK